MTQPLARRLRTLARRLSILLTLTLTLGGVLPAAAAPMGAPTPRQTAPVATQAVASLPTLPVATQDVASLPTLPDAAPATAAPRGGPPAPADISLLASGPETGGITMGYTETLLFTFVPTARQRYDNGFIIPSSIKHYVGGVGSGAEHELPSGCYKMVGTPHGLVSYNFLGTQITFQGHISTIYGTTLGADNEIDPTGSAALDPRSGEPSDDVLIVGAGGSQTNDIWMTSQAGSTDQVVYVYAVSLLPYDPSYDCSATRRGSQPADPPLRNRAGCSPSPAPVTTHHAGDPINLGDGAWEYRLDCLAIGGAGLPIAVGLFYSTRNWYNKLGSSNVGRGWTVGYTRRLQYDPIPPYCTYNSTTNEVTCTPIIPRWTLYDETGATYTFTYGMPLSSGGALYTGAANNYTNITYDPASQRVVLNYRNGDRDIFSAATGLLARLEDRLGNAVSVTWDTALGTQTLRNERTGQSLILEHEVQTDPDSGKSVWKLRRIKDGNVPTGGTARVITLTYGTSGSALGRLTSIVNAAGQTYTFAYDSQGRVYRYYDRNNTPGVVSSPKYAQNTYDTVLPYRVTQQTLPNGNIITLDWSGASGYNLALTERNATATEQRVTRYNYEYRSTSSTGRIYQIALPTRLLSDAPQGWINYYYDAAGNPTGETNGYNYLGYIYNAQGDLTQVYRQYYFSVLDRVLLETNAYGQITKQTDAEGYVTTWSYNATTGLLEQIARLHKTDSTQKLTTTISYAPVTINGVAVLAGLPTQVSLPDGTALTYAYDTRGYPSTTTYDAGTGKLNLTELTSYDWRGYLLSTTDRQGIQTTYARNNLGWLTSQTRDSATGGRAVKTNYSYDKEGNLTKIIADAGSGKLNATTIYTPTIIGMDGGYAATATTNPLNQTSTIAYSALGDIASATDPLGHSTSYSYTPEGWLASVRAPDGRTLRTLTYDRATGRLLSETDGRGVTTTYSYDTRGRVSGVRLGQAAIGSWPATGLLGYNYTYDNNDHLTEQSSYGGYSRTQWNYTSEPYGRLAWARDALGNQTSYSYDSRDRLTQTIAGDNVDTEQVITQYSYDALDRLTSQRIDPAGKNLTTQYLYSLTGSADRWNLRQLIDPRGKTTTYTYNSLGQLSQVIDATTTSSWSYSYSNLGALTTITPASGATISQTVDLLGRATQLTRNGQSERWAYNPDGTLKSYTDFAGQLTSYSYDVSARLTGINRVGTNADATLTYLANDLLASVTSKPDGTTSETTSYDYDAANRLATRARGGRTISYSYNWDGDLTGIGYWGIASASYSYDTAHRQTGATLFNAGQTMTYRATGQLKTLTFPNAVASTYGYDSAGRLTSIANSRSGVALPSVSYTLDANGNRTSATDQWGTTSYTYNALNRLTQASYPAISGGPAAQTLTYAYDRSGNRTTAGATTASYDASDRLTSAGYAYDANGNLTADPSGATYSYDTANRLIRSVKGGVTTTYQYDGLGNLVRQSSGGVTTDLVLDEASGLPRVLGAIRSNGSQTLYGWSAAGLVAQQDTVGGVTSLSYPLLDGQGSLMAWTRASDGAVTQRVAFDAWGAPRYLSGTNPGGGSGLAGFGYSGEWTNPDGTVHLRARSYQPTLGRFLQRDSYAGLAARPQSLNRYTYVEGNPVNLSDPSGLTPPVRVEVDISDKSFRRGTSRALPVGDGQARRHIVGDEPASRIIERSLNGLESAEDQADVLRQVGYDPARYRNDINQAARGWWKDIHNDTNNLWVGDQNENSRLGARSRPGGSVSDYPRIDPVPPDYDGPGARFNPDVWDGPPDFDAIDRAAALRRAASINRLNGLTNLLGLLDGLLHDLDTWNRARNCDRTFGEQIDQDLRDAARQGQDFQITPFGVMPNPYSPNSREIYPALHYFEPIGA